MAGAVRKRNHHQAGFWRNALHTEARVLSALFFRESETRRGRRFSLGYVAAGLEPLLVIITITMVFYTIGRQAPYGHSLFLFIATGVFPIYLFIHTSMRLRGALAPGSHRKRYPIETSFDHIMVHGVLHIISTALIGCSFFAFLYWFGIREALPWDPLNALLAVSIFFLFGVGAGIINSVIARLFPPWDTLWPALARGSLHFSAPYFVAAYEPPNVRWYFGLNPVIHAVNWFRQSFYFFYPNQLTTASYPLAFAIVMIVVGLLLEAGMRTYLEDKE
jgi:capsular polysaccharide transport system permease protein